MTDLTVSPDLLAGAASAAFLVGSAWATKPPGRLPLAGVVIGWVYVQFGLTHGTVRQCASGFIDKDHIQHRQVEDGTMRLPIDVERWGGHGRGLRVVFARRRAGCQLRGPASDLENR